MGSSVAWHLPRVRVRIWVLGEVMMAVVVAAEASLRRDDIAGSAFAFRGPFPLRRIALGRAAARIRCVIPQETRS